MYKKLMIAMGAALLLAGNAMAVQYVDNNEADTRLDANYLGGFNPLYLPSYTGQFNLTDYGYNPATQDVISAVATFTLWDTPIIGGGEGYRIRVEGLTLYSGGSFSGFINLGGNVNGSLLANLSDDGILNYTVTATSGVFWLVNANLTAEATAPSVPDGGATAGLLGLSLLGLAGFRARK